MYRGNSGACETCEAPNCKAYGGETCVTWGHRLCYPHFAHWMQGKAYLEGREPTREEWMAFMDWLKKPRQTNGNGPPDAEEVSGSDEVAGAVSKPQERQAG